MKSFLVQLTTKLKNIKSEEGRRNKQETGSKEKERRMMNSAKLLETPTMVKQFDTDDRKDGASKIEAGKPSWMPPCSHAGGGTIAKVKI